MTDHTVTYIMFRTWSTLVTSYCIRTGRQFKAFWCFISTLIIIFTIIRIPVHLVETRVAIATKTTRKVFTRLITKTIHRSFTFVYVYKYKIIRVEYPPVVNKPITLINFLVHEDLFKKLVLKSKQLSILSGLAIFFTSISFYYSCSHALHALMSFPNRFNKAIRQFALMHECARGRKGWKKILRFSFI